MSIKTYFDSLLKQRLEFYRAGFLELILIILLSNNRELAYKHFLSKAANILIAIGGYVLLNQ